MKDAKWVKFKDYERAKEASLPGVWMLKTGGFLVRGRVKSEKTGKLVEVCHAVDKATPAEALVALQQELKLARSGGMSPLTSRPRFHEFATLLFEERVVTGEIKSPSSRRGWMNILTQHLLKPSPEGFGDMFLDAITPIDVAAWRVRCAALVANESVCLACRGTGRVEMPNRLRGTNIRCTSCKGEGRRRYGPRTINLWIEKLKVILSTARKRKVIPDDPSEGINPLPTDTAHTYTEEEPNSLLVDEAIAFLETMLKIYPKWYGITVLGMFTGWRPSQLRPLRRQGLTPDFIRFDTGAGLVYSRRSHSEGREIIEKPKNGQRHSVEIPDWLVSVLNWHIMRLDALPENHPQRRSELLFPGVNGEVLDEGCLYKPFVAVAEQAGIKKHITPRALRRTYQDIQRAAKTPDVITRSISGHISEVMQHHYSTVAGQEQRAAIDGMGMLLKFPVGGMGTGMKEGGGGEKSAGAAEIA